VVKLNTKEIKEDDFYFAQAVAGFGMILRDSQYRGNLTLDKALEIAKKAKGKDINGYRAEFIKMLEKAKLLKETK
jgi:Ca-activated chloride channel family protein